jgi:hypothetical protein
MIVALNVARGSLKTKLHAEIERPMLDLVTGASCKSADTCESKDKILWAYTKALVDTHAWPLKIMSKGKSLTELHAALGKFHCVNPEPSEDHCKSIDACGVDFDDIVQRAVADSRESFDGLCLGELPMIRSGVHVLTHF